jgi:hypothetical protein
MTISRAMAHGKLAVMVEAAERLRAKL